MVRTLARVLLIVMLMAPAMVSAEDRFGFVDSGTVLERHPRRAAAEERMESLRSELAAKLETMKAEHAAKVAAFTRSQDAGAPDQALFDAVKSYEDEIDAFLDRSSDDVQRLESDLLQPMVDDANRVIAEVAKEEGFTCVLDTSSGAVVFIDTARDITIKVIQKLRAEATGQ